MRTDERLLAEFQDAFSEMRDVEASTSLAFVSFERAEAHRISKLLGRAKRLRGQSESARRLRRVTYIAGDSFSAERYRDSEHGSFPVINAVDIEWITQALFGDLRRAFPLGTQMDFELVCPRV